MFRGYRQSERLTDLQYMGLFCRRNAAVTFPSPNIRERLPDCASHRTDAAKHGKDGLLQAHTSVCAKKVHV